MATEVLLMTDVKDLGAEGGVVTVADGYARNYLLPRKLAAPVTKAARLRLEKSRKERESVRAQTLAAAQTKAKELANVSCTIAVKASDEQKLYGSVGVGEIADALAAQGVKVDRQAIGVEHPIKELGVFDVPIKLHPDVDVTVKVWVVQE